MHEQWHYTDVLFLAFCTRNIPRHAQLAIIVQNRISFLTLNKSQKKKKKK